MSPGFSLRFLVIALLISSPATVVSSAQIDASQVGLLPRSSDNACLFKTRSTVVRSNVDLVLVPVLVTNSRNESITNLRKEDFRVTQDSVEQHIRYLSEQDDPLSVGIILDLSRSMKNKEQRLHEAVTAFMSTANPEDEVFLMSFGDKPRLLVDWTTSPEEITTELLFVDSGGNTSLLDAVYLGLEKLKKAAPSHRKALLIISDGGDNHSRFTNKDVKRWVMESDAQIYSIGVFSPFPQTDEEVGGPNLLRGISEISGGKLFNAADILQLPDIAANVGRLLRTQFVLAYVPERKPRDGKWHKIKVKVMPGSFSLTYKQGFFAPTELVNQSHTGRLPDDPTLREYLDTSNPSQ